MDERAAEIYRRAFDTLNRLADFVPTERDLTAPDALESWDASRPQFAPLTPQPQPQPPDWSGWDRWCRAHISRALGDFADAIGGEIIMVEDLAALRDELLTEINQLKADMALLRAEMSGSVKSLRGHDASDAA